MMADPWLPERDIKDAHTQSLKSGHQKRAEEEIAH